MSYYPHNPLSQPLDVKIVDHEDVVGLFLKHTVPSDGSFVPEKIEVRGSSGKNTNTEAGRILILGQDMLHYKVFQAPSQDSGRSNLTEDVPMS